MSIYEGHSKETALRPVPLIKPVRGEELNERRLTIFLTPITNTSYVLSPCVKHRTNNHEASRDGTFTNSENKTTSKETGKVLASHMAT